MKLTEIRQGNNITLARYDYTALEINLLTLLFEQVNRHGNSDFVTYSINLKDLYQLANFDRSNLSRIKEALRSIRSKDFEVFDKEELIYTNTVIITSFQIHERQDLLFINIDPFMRPFLYDIVKNTTRYYRESILRLPGKNSKRIYQICSMFKVKGECKIELTKLKEKLGLENEKYQGSFSMFKKKVLDVAMKEINELSDLVISYSLNKEGKKITDIIFHVDIKPGMKEVNTGAQYSEQELKLREVLAKEWNQAAHIIENAISHLGTEKIYKLIYEAKLKQGINNKSGYLYQTFINLGVPKVKQIYDPGEDF